MSGSAHQQNTTKHKLFFHHRPISTLSILFFYREINGLFPLFLVTIFFQFVIAFINPRPAHNLYQQKEKGLGCFPNNLAWRLKQMCCDASERAQDPKSGELGSSPGFIN
jgi:hypothetical protein